MSTSLAKKLNLGVPSAAAGAVEAAKGATAPAEDVSQQIEQARSAGFEEGRAAGEASATAAERARIGSILKSEQAEGRRDMALHLALETDLKADEALALLEHAPKAAKGAGLAVKMQAEAIPSTGAPPPEPSGGKSEADELEQHVAGLQQFDPKRG